MSLYIDGPDAIPPSDGVNNYSTAFLLSDLSGASWTATDGTPTSASGAIFIWQSPNAPNTTVRITAVSAGVTYVHDVLITGLEFNYPISSAVEGSVDDVGPVRTLESGARRGRRKVPPKSRWELTFRGRSVTEYRAVLDLFTVVGKLQPFSMVDPLAGTRLAFFFDSGINRTVRRSGKIDYAFRVVQA